MQFWYLQNRKADRPSRLPATRNRGIANEEHRAFFPNAQRFELFTGAKSTDNIRLYQKLGYEEYRQQDLSKKVRIVFMEKIR